MAFRTRNQTREAKNKQTNTKKKTTKKKIKIKGILMDERKM